MSDKCQRVVLIVWAVERDVFLQKLRDKLHPRQCESLSSFSGQRKKTKLATIYAYFVPGTLQVTLVYYVIQSLKQISKIIIITPILQKRKPHLR